MLRHDGMTLLTQFPETSYIHAGEESFEGSESVRQVREKQNPEFGDGHWAYTGRLQEFLSTVWCGESYPPKLLGPWNHPSARR